jgi:hypothetical protein
MMAGLVVALSQVGGSSSAALGGAASHPAPSTDDVSTVLLAEPLAAARPVPGTDGLVHLPYELQLMNPVGPIITIDKVEIIDQGSGRPLQVLEGEALAALVLPIGATEGTTLDPGGLAFLVLDLALPARARPPRALVHRFTLTFEPEIPELPTVIEIARTEVVRENAVVVDRPLDGAGWLDANGCCATLTSHRAAVNLVNGTFALAQRFAIDFVQLDEDGRLFNGAPGENASFPGYGEPVRSVADGVVVRVLDGVPDNTPFEAPPIDPSLRTVPGNHVVVDIGGGRFAGYGHLQPGSPTVRVGQRVRRGDVLGLLGNSGNSDFPHLHFQVTNAAGFLGGDGRPYVFRSFDSVGTLANPDEFLGGEPAEIDPALAGHFERRLPLDLQIVDFGSRRGGR